MSHWWVIERQEGTPDVYLPNEAVTRQSSVDGINPATVRKALLDVSENGEVVFQLVGRDGEVTAAPTDQPTDILFWSWVPIFSNRTRKLILAMGGSQDDFVRCKFASRPGDVFFLHLPSHSFDVVDLTTSKFTMMIQLQPPLPHGIRVLGVRDVPEKMPPCFRLAVPGHSQVFGDLVVSELMRDAWDAALLTGAAFRKVA